MIWSSKEIYAVASVFEKYWQLQLMLKFDWLSQDLKGGKIWALPVFWLLISKYNLVGVRFLTEVMQRSYVFLILTASAGIWQEDSCRQPQRGGVYEAVPTSERLWFLD